MPRFLPPKVADWLIYNVDRPLGFYIAILLGIVSGYGFATDLRDAPLFARWPVPALAVFGFVFAITGVCLLLVVLWVLWKALLWSLYFGVVVPIDWTLTQVKRYGRGDE